MLLMAVIQSCLTAHDLIVEDSLVELSSKLKLMDQLRCFVKIMSPRAQVQLDK